MNNFELHLRAFQNFIDETEDRLQLIIDDKAQLVFNENFIMINVESGELAKLSYEKMYPSVEILIPISRSTIEIIKNIANNAEELLDIIKQYKMMLNQNKKNFETTAIMTDEVKIFADEIRKIETNRLSYTGLQFFLARKDLNGTNINVYIIVKDYGGPKRLRSTVQYYTIDDEGNQQVIGEYTIDKHELVNDIAYQVVTGKIIHQNELFDHTQDTQLIS